MGKLIDNFCDWDPLGQAIFIIAVLLILCGFVLMLVYGPPPAK